MFPCLGQAGPKRQLCTSFLHNNSYFLGLRILERLRLQILQSRTLTYVQSDILPWMTMSTSNLALMLDMNQPLPCLRALQANGRSAHCKAPKGYYRL